MAILDIRQRSGYLFLAIILGHIILISAQVNSRSGVPVLEQVTFGIFSEIQRAMSTGFGIWATHFIAMLAFSPGVPTAYNIALTGLSLVAAIFLTGIGLGVAVASMAGPRWSTWLGGALGGGGIAAMHYTGMAAFEIMGRIVWDPVLVAASILLGALSWKWARPLVNTAVFSPPKIST